MGQSLVEIYVHIVFSTKHRQPFLRDSEFRARTHAYLAGILRNSDCPALVVGGVEDHVHLLIGFKASHRIDYLLRDLKADSSAWVHNVLNRKIFSWQQGYAALSVSPSNLEDVRQYVLRQEEHHRRKTFREELIELLIESGIEFKEEYLL